MTKTNKIHIFWVFGFALMVNQVNVFGQNDCANSLRNAERFYESGLLEEVAPLLQPCLPSFNKTQKQQAYRLLILSYLYEDKQAKADSLMFKLLQLNPEYTTSQQLDPPEFIELHKSYKTLPSFSIGAYAGTNFSSVNVINSFGVHNTENSEEKYISDGFGLQLGGYISKYLFSRVQINGGLRICNNKFTYINKNFLGYSENDGFTSLKLDETDTKIEFPILFEYSFLSKNFQPKLILGGTGGYLLQSQADLERYYTDNIHQTETSSSINILKHRERLQLNITAGFGASYKIKSGNLNFNVLYNKGLENAVVPKERYDAGELIYVYYYVDDDFKLNNLMINFGYSYSFYKPKKRK